MKLHPSGLTMDRWNWPFKTEQEKAQVLRYLYPDRIFEDTNNPF